MSKLYGGLAEKAKATPKDFDKKELKMGTRNELEHTSDSKIAKQIAMDHLTENPKYYTKYKQFESGSHLNHPNIKVTKEEK